MTSQREHIVMPLLVSNEESRHYLFQLLKRNHYNPVLMIVPERLLDTLKSMSNGIVFLDGEAVSIYGAGIYSKIKMACPGCRIILLCAQAHRDLIKEAIELGVYGCILEPYKEWEVLTMVRHILADISPTKRKVPEKRKKS